MLANYSYLFVFLPFDQSKKGKRVDGMVFMLGEVCGHASLSCLYLIKRVKCTGKEKKSINRLRK